MLNHKIKELRKAADMNKTQLAKAVGVSDVTISYWESGAIKQIGSDRLVSLANVFGLSVSELLDDPLKDKPGLEWALSLCEEDNRADVIGESINTRLENMK